MKIKILLMIILPLLANAGLTKSELIEVQNMLNQSFAQKGIAHKAMNVYAYNDADGKTLVFVYRGKMVDAGTRTAEQIKNNMFTGMTQEDIDAYKSWGYSRVKVVVLKGHSYYYLR
tara:strand:- start:1476 stop:1823 length:348 start_codon:yes stop_codon:yes gene_type:complete